MSEEEFDKHKDALAVSFTMKPKGMMEQMYVYQTEMDTRDYNFSKAQIVVELKSITKNNIVEFYHVSYYAILYDFLM